MWLTRWWCGCIYQVLFGVCYVALFVFYYLKHCYCFFLDTIGWEILYRVESDCCKVWDAMPMYCHIFFLTLVYNPSLWNCFKCRGSKNFFLSSWTFHIAKASYSITQFVNTNTCTYFTKKPFKKLLHVSVYDHLQGVTISSLKSQLFKHSCMYTRCGVNKLS